MFHTRIFHASDTAVLAAETIDLELDAEKLPDLFFFADFRE